MSIIILCDKYRPINVHFNNDRREAVPYDSIKISSLQNVII